MTKTTLDYLKMELQNRLITHYGDDTVQSERIRGLSGSALEDEFKNTFKITSKIKFFRGNL